ncbi:MAG: quinol:cytochrome C oxidoreductase [Ignavibacteriota bacterium]|nr:MAG: quinol:cytochrome C oxidoreductase [Chlorobiota bacterium]MBE7478214.1 quinol:cytochrome C oxidoreductase [Ignavibacteriales bacterium]MBL1121555.1 quinol:cytochrome C oxidoreductase [Ignavibacteriota bacterium]MCC7093585.1 quinol:cytochrome C oxidoreductase [Ignavibacteriaceae bacterium]MCE7855227.1 quinol:cytochrome C oxidoreductase [Ignavibacteria bacterium CHB3]
MLLTKILNWLKRSKSEMHTNDYIYQRKDLPASISKLGMGLLALGVVLGVVAFFVDHSRAVFNYLIAFTFLISIGVGALFLIALDYTSGADWSVPIRRVVEFFAAIIPILAVLVIPLLFNVGELFHWSHPEAVAEDKILQGKSSYLNVTFFIVRVFALIGIWSLFYFFIVKNSKKQDTTRDQKLTTKNLRLSAIFIPIFAVTITISAIDWLMSIEPHWFSTMIGVYFFSGVVIAALAAVTLTTVLLKENGYLHPALTNDHLYSLGALLFAFINFWGYIAFSQYMLIWYADLPEETFWFMQRWEGSWSIFSIGLILIHFVVPYIALVSQPSKMNPKTLKFISVWLLFAHLYDLFWFVMPEVNELSAGYSFSWIDLVFPIAVVGIIILVFNMKAKKENLIPIGDPKLQRGLDFHL